MPNACDFSSILQGLTPQATVRIAQAEKARASLWQRATAHASSQPFTSSLNEQSAMDALQQAAKTLRAGNDYLVVIGTGGASLGAQALCALVPSENKKAENQKSVQFLRNCDAQTMRHLFTSLPLDRTAWLVISKSGETVETLASALALKAHYHAQNKTLDGRVMAISAPKQSALRQLADAENWPVLVHPPHLGGRFSVFSVVGMLPLAFMGVDVTSLMQRVDARFIQHMRQQTEALFTAANWFASSLPEQPMHVMLAYGDALAPLSQWYKQLWAESLGKDLKGPTPVTAIGAIDQHSQLQLYLGGPRDKLFTILAPDAAGVPLPLAATSVAALEYLQAHSIQQIMQVTADATIATLRAHHIPLRVVRRGWDITSASEFMLDLMLETLLVAAQINLDPFTQPTVEEGKVLARQMLGS
jgi:glucose-6-phosphate isomerase